jgi:hypothetical protein
MAKETQVRRISRDAVSAFHYPRSALLDLVSDLLYACAAQSPY